MGYYMRYLVDEDKDINLQLIETALKRVDPSHTPGETCRSWRSVGFSLQCMYPSLLDLPVYLTMSWPCTCKPKPVSKCWKCNGTGKFAG